ncbi:MAG TPA: penicillin-binding protein 1A [Firmicutes bacterium]|nr:penicillin-binding protein 1A [Bacillota bacterium]
MKRLPTRSQDGSILIGLAIFIVLLMCVATGGVIGILAGALKNMPSLEDIEYRPSQTTEVFDANGKLITQFYVENRVWVPLSQIPKDLQHAIIAVEDSHFYEHHGIDVMAIARALLADLRSARKVQGGSTITQQLAKNAFLTHEKTFTRKIQEALYAIQLERRYTKDQILELYLNEIYFGHGAYGVQAAAQIYFGKDVRDLTLAESAMLAGIPRGPSYYSPYENLEAAKNRRATVLARMALLGYITKDQEKRANEAPIVLAGLKPKKHIGRYFADYVLQQLLARYGQDTVYKGGLRVYTTLDLRLQSIAEKALAQNLPRGKVDSRGLTQPQGALVALDPQTGYIKAMVGGRGEDEFNRAVQSYRQPGSAFKPFVYTAAIDNGYTPATTIDDSPAEFVMTGDKRWAPRNYDNKFHGLVTLRQALEESINVASVKLLDEVGIDTAVRYAKLMGITSLVETGRINDRNLSLVLGGLTRGVTPLEMAAAYAVLANQGIKVTPMAIIRVEDANGNVLERNIPRKEIVLGEATCYVVTDMLRGVIERGTGKAANVGVPAAGKTGTTSDNTNAWFVGFTPDLVAAVWIGNDIQAKPLIYGGVRIGSAKAAQIWGVFIREALQKGIIQPREFPVPSGVVLGVKICKESGLLATPACPATRTEVFVKGTEPTEYCKLHGSFIHAKVCRDSGKLATPDCPPESVETRTYLKDSKLEVAPDGTVILNNRLPEDYCDVHGSSAPTQSDTTVTPSPPSPASPNLNPATPE